MNALEPTTIRDLLRATADAIGGVSSDSDAGEILSALLDVNRSWPKFHPDEMADLKTVSAALLAGRMRAEGAPLQYCVGKAAFRHLTLAVDSSVLIPRPETEILVDIVLARVPGGTVADVGTGSGAIALALATEGAYERVIATDLSERALETARENARRYAGSVRGKIEFRLGSLTSPLAGESLDALVSNPPYITDNEMEFLPREVRDWEPESALRSGADGLDATRGLVAGAPAVLRPGGLLALEVDTRRAEHTADILKADGRYEKIEVAADLTGRPRFVTALRR